MYDYQFKSSRYSYGSIYLKWRVITKWKIKKKEEMNKEELQKQLEKRLKMTINYISSFQLLSHVWLFVTPWIAARQASLPSPTPRVYTNSCLSSWWCHPANSSSVVPFSFCSQSLPASGFFQWVNSSHEVAKVLEFQL